MMFKSMIILKLFIIEHSFVTLKSFFVFNRSAKDKFPHAQINNISCSK